MTRILIAEDSARVASFLEKGLKAAGYLTTVSHDGVQTATMARDEDFDLLILDFGQERPRPHAGDSPIDLRVVADGSWRFEVTDHRGEGATFWVRIPR